MTAGEVVERIKGRVGIPWMTETVDRIVAGSPEVRVKGIATTMMATLEVIPEKPCHKPTSQVQSRPESL